LSSNNEEQAKRLAIVVGINKYEDYPAIDELHGAENDAREIHKRLTTLGQFAVLPNHLLLGENATYKAILKAVSDIFRQDIECSLVFSGHGLIDENNDGYIAPYDMDSTDPFVCGIKMEDLREVIYRAKNKESVLLILDCCYAGISTKSTYVSQFQIRRLDLHMKITLRCLPNLQPISLSVLEEVKSY
jgi:uncharacterized caspase-like protein